MGVAPNTMTIQVEADNEDSLARVQQVVVDHLLRFAPGAELQINWAEPVYIFPSNPHRHQYRQQHRHQVQVMLDFKS
jgi:hypothetical protein